MGAPIIIAQDEPPTPPEPPPPTELIPFTCPWAQDGLRKALDGLQGASGGVKGYTIGSRKVEYHGPGDQAKVVDYWTRMVEFYCGVAVPLPGRDTAFRVIQRDV